MAGLVLDSSVLIGFWRMKRAALRRLPTSSEAGEWGRELAEVHDGPGILTPIRLEFLCGIQSSQEKRLADEFLSQSECLDEGRTTPGDWVEAIRIASRVPRDGKPRQAVDCLIKAISKRLKKDVHSHDWRFPRP
jgi:predicted nucleic acid-binding protein